MVKNKKDKRINIEIIFLDNKHFQLSEIIDGLLIDRIGTNESGMYLCIGRIPLPKRLVTSLYPVMVFVSDPLCENIFILFSLKFSFFFF